MKTITRKTLTKRIETGKIELVEITGHNYVLIRDLKTGKTETVIVFEK